MRADVDSRLRSGAIESCLRMNAGITALTHFSQRYPKVVLVQQSHNASASHGFLSLSLSLSLSRRRFQYLQSTKMCFSRSTFLFFTQVRLNALCFFDANTLSPPAQGCKCTLSCMAHWRCYFLPTKVTTRLPHDAYYI